LFAHAQIIAEATKNERQGGGRERWRESGKVAAFISTVQSSTSFVLKLCER